MRLNNLAIVAVLAILGLASGCARDSWDITNPGNQEENNTEFNITLSSPTAMDGEEVYISGSVVPGYLQNPDSMVLFGTFQDGQVVGTFERQVWGNERFSVGFWRVDSDSRYHRMLDISVNGVDLNALQATEFEIYREFQLYVEDGQLMIDPMTDIDDLVEVQLWYTGDTLPEDYMNYPADPEVPVYWWGTWTTFRFTTHPTVWSDDTWTTTFWAAKGATALLRLQLENGNELRSGVFVGPVGEFENATELMNLRDLGGGWNVFEFRVTEDGEVENLRPGDDRLYGIVIGD